MAKTQEEAREAFEPYAERLNENSGCWWGNSWQPNAEFDSETELSPAERRLLLRRSTHQHNSPTKYVSGALLQP